MAEMNQMNQMEPMGCAMWSMWSMAAMAAYEALVELLARSEKSSVYQVGCMTCQDPEPVRQLRREAVADETSAQVPAEIRQKSRK